MLHTLPLPSPHSIPPSPSLSVSYALLLEVMVEVNNFDMVTEVLQHIARSALHSF